MMAVIKKHARCIYLCIMLYSTVVFFIPEHLTISGFFPRPLYELLDDLFGWAIFEAASWMGICSLLLIITLLWIVWVPLAKNNSFLKSAASLCVAFLCVLDIILLLYYGYASHVPFPIQEQTKYHSLMVALDIVCDLLMAFIVLIQFSLDIIKRNKPTENTGDG